MESVARQFALRACAWCCQGALLVAQQIGGAPEFQSSGTVARPAPTVDGTTHTAAEQARINSELIARLRRVPGHEAGVRLLESNLPQAAEEEFRKRGQALGVAVALYLRGNVRASAEAMLRLPRDVTIAPYLGETFGDSPAHRAPMLEALRVIALQHPRDTDAQYYYGKAAQDVPALRAAAEKDTRALLELGRLYTEKEQRAEAVAVLEAALRRDPALKAAHFRLAGLYRALGDPAKSREHMAAFQRAQ